VTRNNPVMRIDPDGLTDYFNLNGDFVFSDNEDNKLFMIVLMNVAAFFDKL